MEGPNFSERADYDLTDPAVTGMIPFGVTDHVARATCDGAVGWGMLEHIGRSVATTPADSPTSVRSHHDVRGWTAASRGDLPVTPGRFADKVFVVTGAASGIGAACASRLCADGATVIGFDIAGADAPGIVSVDVTDEEAVSAAVGAVARDHGRIDGVITAAGVIGGGPVHSLALEEWDRALDINLKGTFLVAKHVPWPCSTRSRSTASAGRS